MNTRKRRNEKRREETREKKRKIFNDMPITDMPNTRDESSQ